MRQTLGAINSVRAEDGLQGMGLTVEERGATQRTSSISEKRSLRESYKGVKLVRVANKHDWMVTQTKGDRLQQANPAQNIEDLLKRRKKIVSEILESESDFLHSLNLQDRALLNVSLESLDCPDLYLQKCVSTAKLIEVYLIVYQMYYSGESNCAEVLYEKIVAKIKAFLRRAKGQILVVEVDRESYEQYSEKDELRRGYFEQMESRAKTNRIEGLVIKYLLLNYTLNPDTLTFRPAANPQSAPSPPTPKANPRLHPSSSNIPEQPLTEEEEPLPSGPIYFMEELRHIARLKEEHQQKLIEGTRANENPIFRSKFRSVIDRCLEKEDELFSMENAEFDRLVGLGTGEKEESSMARDREPAFKSLYELRSYFNHEINTLGMELRNELDLYEVVKETVKEEGDGEEGGKEEI